LAEQFDSERELNTVRERSTARARDRGESMPPLEALPMNEITAPGLAEAINKLPTVASEFDGAAPRSNIQTYLRELRSDSDILDTISVLDEDSERIIPGGGVRSVARPPMRFSSQFEMAMNGSAHDLWDAFSNIDTLGDYGQIKGDIALAGEWMRHQGRREIIEGIRKDLIKDGYPPPELDKRYLPELANPSIMRDIPHAA